MIMDPNNFLILIIDDSYSNLQFLGGTLNKAGYKVAIVQSASKAFDFLENTIPDLILLDIMMPEMDGFEFCQKLKNEKKTEGIPVIFITALIETQFKLKAFAAGGVDYISKPFVPEEVLARVNVFLKIKSVEKKLNRTLKKAGNATRVLKDINVKLKKEKEKAKKAEDAKSLFLANMSHEIRTPMNAVIGFTELLLATKITEEQKDYLQMISNSADSLLLLINDILDFSKIESGKISLNIISTDLKNIVESIIKTLTVQAIKNAVKLKYSIAENIPQYVLLDALRLRQILINLVGNGIKFTSDGNVEVNCEKIIKDKKAYLQFIIADTGIGIPQEKIKKLFNPFTQLDSSLNRKYQGTGLGLVISKSLVEIMGGEIFVESQIGKGSKFSFTIPLQVTETSCEKEQEKLEELEEVKFENAGENQEANKTVKKDKDSEINIILAEDNVINQKLVKIIIEKLGWSVEIAWNGKEVLKLLEQKDFDLILMDMHMPEMDGIQATKIIRKLDNKSKDIPIIALTANAYKEDKIKCIDVGMNDFMAKPLNKEDLRKIILKYVQK